MEVCRVTKAKIRIPDDTELRSRLDQEYEDASQAQLCRYALMLADHILNYMDGSKLNHDTIREGLWINEQWQKGNTRVHDVRQASFKIHQLAKESEDVMICTALRVVGHAVATAHMREHAMVASDYAVKAVCLLHPDCMDAVRNERLWQIQHLQEIKGTMT
jgi:hypothetical protein